MRDDRQRLTDVLEAIELIQTFSSGKTLANLVSDRLYQSAVLHQLYVIGESASKVSETLKSRHRDVPWKVIYGFRNHIAHEYFALDLNIVWQTIREDLPKLKTQLDKIAKSEFSL
jgi:uncharacterized protein with HEPN domain